jgi:hypothetical protein
VILDADTTEITRRNVPAASLLDRDYWADLYRLEDGSPWCGSVTVITEAGRAQLYVRPDGVTMVDKATRPLTDAEATALAIWIAERFGLAPYQSAVEVAEMIDDGEMDFEVTVRRIYRRIRKARPDLA